MNKEQIRLRIRTQKAILTPEERAEAALRVFDALERSAAFMVANRILVYHSLADELDTRRFIDKWSTRKQFYLPRVNGVNLEVLPYEKSRLHLGAFRIEEPTGSDVRPVSEVELIIVPGVAFDAAGSRVGRGKGYYDRLLAGSRAHKVGVAYEFQMVDRVDAEPHDCPVDVVITDEATYYAASRTRKPHA